MSIKGDQSGVKTPQDLERKYNFDEIKKAVELSKTGVTKIEKELETLAETVAGEFVEVNANLDGKVEIHFYKGVPMLTNEPASDWLVSEYPKHEGDMYYDTDGYVYRFINNNNVYSWEQIDDQVALEAIALANAAQNTADSKRQVFVIRPSPPYEKGDLWIFDDDIYVCKVDKKTGEYSEADFEEATTFKKDIESANTNITVLQGDVAKVNKVFAEEISAEDLAVTRATIAKLIANAIETGEISARIADLEEVDIKELKATTAKIDKLIYGVASGDTITANFVDTVVALIGDATIAGAKIISLDAGKIRTGTLDTNHVKIHSEDGSLKIEDNVIIINDKTRTRVQIGKDSNGDYNLYVCDDAGNVMFDALGLKEAGIKNPIIDNDAIKEDAKISGGKLDIESLFTTMNESEQTLKSSKIYFDDEEQTLDVKFSKVYTKTEVENKIDDAIKDGPALLRIDSSKGNLFKNNMVSTVMSVTVFFNGKEIKNKAALIEAYGNMAHLEWKWKKMGEENFHTILSTDKRLSNDGFVFSVSPEDVDVKVVFQCDLVI